MSTHGKKHTKYRIYNTTGVYGDVQRVKILYNKKDSALIQMAEPHQAYLGENIRYIFLKKNFLFCEEFLFFISSFVPMQINYLD